MKKNRLLWSWCVVGGLFLFGFATALAMKKPLFARLPDGRVIYPWGAKLNPHPLKMTEPLASEQKLGRIYDAILAFRQATGRLPTAPSELLQNSESSHELHGADDLGTADYRLSDRYAQGLADHGFAFDLLAGRPDGTPKPAFPKQGEKDAWVSTDVYVRTNAVLYPDWNSKRDPGGFFLVLWSDGSIERIPYDDLCYAQIGNTLAECYPGQTGLKPGAITNRTMKRHWYNAVPAIVGNHNAPTPN